MNRKKITTDTETTSNAAIEKKDDQPGAEKLGSTAVAKTSKPRPRGNKLKDTALASDLLAEGETHQPKTSGEEVPPNFSKAVVADNDSHARGQEHRASKTPSGKAVWIAIPLFFFALAAVGGLPRLARSKKLTGETEQQVKLAEAVNVLLPHLTPNSGDLVLPSSVQAVEETTVFARTSGYLKKRFADIGSRVKAGQLLAIIESPETDQQVLQAEADAVKAQAGSGQAAADVVRLQASVQQAKSETSRAQAGVEQAKADLEHQSAKLEQASSAVNVAKAKLVQAKENLEGKRADLQHSQAQLQLARKTLDRWKELEKVDAVSGQEVDEKQAAFEVSQANVSASKASVSSAQADVDAVQAAVLASLSEMNAAQADVKSSAQKVNAAQSALLSTQSLVEAAKASVTASRSNAEAMHAAVNSSRAAARRYSAMQAYEQVVAPFSGVITARNVDTGALISPGSGGGDSDPTRTVPRNGLFGIARTDTLRIQINAPQSYVRVIKVGQKARVLFQEYPGRSFDGVIVRTSGALDASSRTLLVEIHLPNPQNLLMPGMFAQVELTGSHSSPVLRIPANTLIVDASGTRVATVDHDSKVHFIKVETGRDYGKEIEVRTGLVGNERLIANPDGDLVEGNEVRVMETAK